MLNSSVTLVLAVRVSLEPWSPLPGEDSVLYNILPGLPRTLIWGYFIGYGNSQAAFEKRILRKVIWL